MWEGVHSTDIAVFFLLGLLFFFLLFFIFVYEIIFDHVQQDQEKQGFEPAVK